MVKQYKNELGQLHREDGPAQEWDDGSKVWFINGLRHRVDGPAIEWSSGCKRWYINGKLHREDGPAVESYTGNIFCLNDKLYKKEEYEKELIKIKLKRLINL